MLCQHPHHVPRSTSPSCLVLASTRTMADEEQGGALEEAQRREALRKKGADFFAQVLEAKQQGKTETDTAIQAVEQVQQKAKAAEQEPQDPEFRAFGEIFNQSKHYVYAILYVVCQASSPVLVSVGKSPWGRIPPRFCELLLSSKRLLKRFVRGTVFNPPPLGPRRMLPDAFSQTCTPSTSSSHRDPCTQCQHQLCSASCTCWG